MKILFVVNDYLTSPLGVGYLSSILKRHDNQTEVVELRDNGRLRRLLADSMPDILALSLVSGRHFYFLDLARKIKREYPPMIVLAGGSHPTFFPEVINEEGIDAVCRGEGENAILPMVDALVVGGGLPESSANWWIKLPDGTISQSDVAPLVTDLDSFPYPDQDIFDKVYPPSLRITIFALASRGCPYHCTYCFNHAYLELYRGKGTICRRRSVKNLMGELIELKRRYPLQIIIFQDDIFILDREWLTEFAGIYPREIGLPFHCHLRANLVDEEVISLLRRSGCLSVKLALESANDHIRNEILKRNMTLEQYLNACMLLHKYGTCFVTQNIIGVPGSTLKDDVTTYEFNLSLRHHYTFATMLKVYPRTRIADYALKHGYIDRKATDIPSTFFADSPLCITDKTERGRLRALFATGVGLGWATRLVKALIRFPLRWLYELLDKLWKGYCIRFRIYPYRQGVMGFLREMRAFLQDNYY